MSEQQTAEQAEQTEIRTDVIGNELWISVPYNSSFVKHLQEVKGLQWDGKRFIVPKDFAIKVKLWIKDIYKV